MIDTVAMWHEKARPKPTNADFQVQLGCHFEEIAEQMEELLGNDEYSHQLLVRATANIHKIADALKSGAASVFIRDRERYLDSLCDQIVTATGVGHCARMNVTEGLRRVNHSNWTKTVNGEFERDKNGKIIKPDTYQPPNLEGLY